MSHEIVLAGCRPEPLGSYLKAIGVLRLVASQTESSVLGWWNDSTFVLRSARTAEEIVQFFLTEWIPTPVLSPWNKDGQISATTLGNAAASLKASTEPRFAPYRQALEIAQQVLAEVEAEEVAAHRARRKVDMKAMQLRLLRNRLPDEALGWLDAVVAVGDDVAYSPLLGTGGNDGRFDFAKHFMEQLQAALDLPSKTRVRRRRHAGSSTAPRGESLLRAALFADPAVLERGPVGMHFPGQADVKFSPIGGDSLVNPWDVVLAVEGAIAFAPAFARRAGSAQARATFPFAFAGDAITNFAAAEGEDADGEFWAPLWSRPATYPEVARLLAEGRAEWNGRQARAAVDAARAACSLGVDRGISAFSRHLVVVRRGKSRLAQAVGRIAVREDPSVGVLTTIDGWLSRLRDAKMPPAVRAASAAVDRALWEATTASRASSFLGVLAAVADCERAVSCSPKARERVAPVVLDASRWWGVVDDGTTELRLAAALASARDPDGSSLRLLLRPQRRDAHGRLTWLEPGDGPRVQGFGRRPLPEVLADALVQRTLDVLARSDDTAHRGVQPAFLRAPIRARLADLTALVDRTLDLVRLERALNALLVLDRWQPLGGPRVPGALSAGAVVAPPVPLGLLVPFFCPQPLRLAGRDEPLVLTPQSRWPHALRAGRLGEVLGEARLRLQMERLEVAPTDVSVMANACDPIRVAAALLVPVEPVDARDALLWLAPPSEANVAPASSVVSPPST